MTIRIGIKGFGRIGTMIARICAEDHSLGMKVVAISERPSAKNAELCIRQHVANLGVDSTYGHLSAEISRPIKQDTNVYVFDLSGEKVTFYFESDERNVPWGKHGVDVLIDCSITADQDVGKSRLEKLRSCLVGSVKYAVVSRSQDDVDATVMVGVNEYILEDADLQIISSSSCTGYASAPIIKLIDDWYGIEMVKLLTIHPNQNFESSVDGVGLSGGMSRGSIGNVKAVDSGVVKSVLSVLPHLEGKISSSPLSYRTPTASGSFIIFEIVTQCPVVGGVQAFNRRLEEAAEKSNGLIGYGIPLFSGHTYPNTADVKGTKYSVLMSPDRTCIENINEGSWITLEGLHDTEMGYAASLLRTVDCIMRQCSNYGLKRAG